MKVYVSLSTINGVSLSDVILDRVGMNGGNVMSDFEMPIISGLKWIGGKMIKKAANAIESFGGDAVDNLLDRFKNKIANALSYTLTKNNISAEISIEKITKEGNNLDITFSVSKIDYNSIIYKFLPIILEKYISKDPIGPIAKIISILDKDVNSIVFSVLDCISDEKKEDIFKVIAEKYQDMICGKLTEFMKEQNIDIEINKLSVI